MTRCEEFYEKWRRYPNWCEKTKGAISQINAYIKVVDELEMRGVDPSFVYKTLPEAQTRKLPKDESRESVLDKIADKLRSGQSYYQENCEKAAAAAAREIITTEAPFWDPIIYASKAEGDVKHAAAATRATITKVVADKGLVAQYEDLYQHACKVMSMWIKDVETMQDNPLIVYPEKLDEKSCAEIRGSVVGIRSLCDSALERLQM